MQLRYHCFLMHDSEHDLFDLILDIEEQICK